MTQMPQDWDETLIKAWLAEAADTLRRLPGGRLRQRLTHWPEVVQDSALGGAGRCRPAALVAPPPRAIIDRMERVLTWLFACDKEERRLVWARACRVSWRRLEDLDGRSHVTLRRVYNCGLAAIRCELCARAAARPAGQGVDNPIIGRK